MALSNVNDSSGNPISNGSTATFFSLQGLDSTDYDSIFASYLDASIGSATYTAGFFGASVGHLSGIELNSGFTTGDSFGIVVTDASTGLDSFYADAGWVAPNDGFTVAGTTYTGNAVQLWFNLGDDDTDDNQDSGDHLISTFLFDGDADDSTGENHGVINGATLVSDRFGSSGNAFNFEGDDFISINNLEVPSEISISIWIKSSGANNRDGSTTLFGSDFLNIEADDDDGFSYEIITDRNMVYQYNGNGLNTTQWDHMCITKSTSELKLYINGVLLVPSITHAVDIPSTETRIGGRMGSTPMFNGLIDDIKIFGKFLSHTEVQEIYNEESPSLDNDNDTLSNGLESIIYLTDPNDSDSDDDGLTDGFEVNTSLTGPNDSDSDDDGLTDGFEVNTSLTDPNDSDSDDDGLTDGTEIHLYSSNPLSADTSGDGFNDGFIAGEGLNPSTDFSALRSRTIEEVRDLRPGSTMIEVAANQATIQLQIEESDDLESWTETGTPASISIPADTDTKFFRFKIAE